MLGGIGNGAGRRSCPHCALLVPRGVHSLSSLFFGRARAGASPAARRASSFRRLGAASVASWSAARTFRTAWARWPVMAAPACAVLLSRLLRLGGFACEDTRAVRSSAAIALVELLGGPALASSFIDASCRYAIDGRAAARQLSCSGHSTAELLEPAPSRSLAGLASLRSCAGGHARLRGVVFPRSSAGAAGRPRRRDHQPMHNRSATVSQKDSCDRRLDHAPVQRQVGRRLHLQQPRHRAREFVRQRAVLVQRLRRHRG